MMVKGLVDMDLLASADWYGTIFLVDFTRERPPAIGMVLENEVPGRRFFQDVIAKLGRKDDCDLLRVSIIEGELPGMAPGYTVMMGMDALHYGCYLHAEGITTDEVEVSAASQFQRTLVAPQAAGLPRFKNDYWQHGHCLIVPLFGTAGYDQFPDFSLALKKERVQFRYPFQIEKWEAEYPFLCQLS